jgi:AcrR family transcriptional regulator
MSRRNEAKAETRKLVLQAARNLFWERGNAQCTIRDIAREARVSPATVIVHFKSKTALLEATLHEDIEGRLGEALQSAPRDGTLQDIFLHMVRAMLSLYNENRELYRVLIRDTLFEPDHENPTISKLTGEYLEFMAQLLEERKKSGEIREGVDAQLAAAALFSLYIGVLREFLRNKEMAQPQAETLAGALLDQYFNGILRRLL